MNVLPDHLKDAVKKFASANILVIGDIIVDHFIWGSVSRISPEAPVPVVNVTHEDILLGGAANVLHNIYDMGGQVTLCGIIGDDYMGNRLLDLLGELGSSKEGILQLTDHLTTKKTRIIAQNQQVVRFDRERDIRLSKDRIQQLMDFIEHNLTSFDAIILSDYDKGMICTEVMDCLRTKLQSCPDIPVIVDPKPRHGELFHGTTLLTPNKHEAEILSGITITDEESLTKAAQKIMDNLGTQSILITQGEAGMALLENGNPIITIPTMAKEVYDVTGAGDTVIATLALALACKVPLPDAAALANFAAGIVVGKVGTATASAHELLTEQ